MRDTAFIAALKAEKDDVAREAMEVVSPDLFDYGKAVGIYEGLARAEALLLQLYEDQDAKERDL